MLETRNNQLFIGGCRASELAEQYGTPLYVMDEEIIRKNCRDFLDSMNWYYKNGHVIFASKAFNCLEICRIMKEENLFLDVVSGGELYTALQADFPAENIFFHGNNKTDAEIKMALSSGVGRIVADNLYELGRLNEIAGKMGKTVNVLFRIKPGVEAHTHDYIRTGQIDSKFGFALENGEAFEAAKSVRDMEHVALTGLHCHIGSQIFDIVPFKEAAQIMLQFFLKLKNELGMTLTELNLGGGFGIQYVDTDTPQAPENFMKGVSEVITGFCKENAMDEPQVLIEPGRAIVGPAGVTLYTVGAVKEIKDIRNYVAIDGSMGDNPRYALYESEYTVKLADKMEDTADYTATIAGKCCESGDLIQKDTLIPKSEPGDIMAVFGTGAYNYSMSSNYNRIPRPAVVMTANGASRVIVKGETYADLIRNDV